MTKKTKNDIAWEEIFKEYRILYYIAKNGFYEILASEIREYREPRLMCKFDHENNLPDIFANNNLSILPISRKAYVIGKFSLFAGVEYDEEYPIEMSPPYNLQTLKESDLYSESAALHFAYHSGMINHFLGERTKHTVSGRMGSGNFSYDVLSKEGHIKTIDVEGAQIEIDGGFEGNTFFALVEAKKEKTSDFNVRQLFYPYRVWRKRIGKEVVPVFFTHSNDVFSFFMYKFEDEDVFNSFKLVKRQNYIVAHDKITSRDLDEIANNVTKFVTEPKVPFPQADSFVRVIDLLANLYTNDISKDEITTLYDFDKRQTDYYANSCIYLGLATSYKDDDDIMITLNDEGRRVMELPYRQKYLTLASKILEHEVFKKVYDNYVKNSEVGKDYIINKMKQSNLYNINSDSTFSRRSSTIRGWIEWICSLPNNP